MPRVIRDASPPEDLDARAEREEFRVSGMSGLRPTPQHVQDVYGGDWEAAPRPPAPAAEPGGPTPPAGAGALASDPRADDAIGAAIEEAIAGDGWEPMMDPVIEPILAEASAALARGDSLEAFRDRLPELFGEMDDADACRHAAAHGLLGRALRRCRPERRSGRRLEVS